MGQYGQRLGVLGITRELDQHPAGNLPTDLGPKMHGLALAFDRLVFARIGFIFADMFGGHRAGGHQHIGRIGVGP